MLYTNQRSARKVEPSAPAVIDRSIAINRKPPKDIKRRDPDAVLYAARFIERRYGINPVRARLLAELAFAVGPRR